MTLFDFFDDLKDKVTDGIINYLDNLSDELYEIAEVFDDLQDS